ncbi:MAG: diheme cytochrome c [Sulfurimonas sp.]|uniref:diheme cytochrome c n=1 Tax=Sulfurimonas sp. TaxID=2022749 RepID=UPI0028CFABEE|nr:diheme cytochrome c [Sulfurimonas sp.]MDT8338098.1 diheme cytochrome c [Sulfurimonas sp.]
MKSLILFAMLGGILLAGSYEKKGVAPVTNELYKKECGSCHFAYQPGLLPSNAWAKMMSNLQNHFDTDATLEKDDFNAVLEYLHQNSAEKAMKYKRSNKIVKSIRHGEVPESISKTPYMVKKHREIREDLITQDEVKGLFNCSACHTTAEKGIYSEKDILIPNYGKWED